MSTIAVAIPVIVSQVMYSLSHLRVTRIGLQLFYAESMSSHSHTGCCQTDKNRRVKLHKRVDSSKFPWKLFLMPCQMI